jgi:hypothetical protein
MPTHKKRDDDVASMALKCKGGKKNVASINNEMLIFFSTFPIRTMKKKVQCDTT